MVPSFVTTSFISFLDMVLVLLLYEPAGSFTVVLVARPKQLALNPRITEGTYFRLDFKFGWRWLLSTTTIAIRCCCSQCCRESSTRKKGWGEGIILEQMSFPACLAVYVCRVGLYIRAYILCSCVCITAAAAAASSTLLLRFSMLDLVWMFLCADIKLVLVVAACYENYLLALRLSKDCWRSRRRCDFVCADYD